MSESIRAYCILAEARTAAGGTFGTRQAISPFQAEVPKLLERARENALATVARVARERGIELAGAPYILTERVEEFWWDEDDDA
jgi:hypothetical protein